MLEYVQAGTSLLNALNGLGGGAAQPGVAQSGMGPTTSRSDVDFSGWTVATGGSKADGAKINKTSSDATGAAPAAGGIGGLSPPLILGLAAGAGLLWRTLNN